MDVNAGLIDQRVNALVGRRREELVARLGQQARNDEHKLKSAAFTLLCGQALLALDEESALDALTDGSQDAGVDLLHIADVIDGEFVVTIIQSKYSKSLDGMSGFPANSIVRVMSTINMIFAPRKSRACIRDLKSLWLRSALLFWMGIFPKFASSCATMARPGKTTAKTRSIRVDSNRKGYHSDTLIMTYL